MCKRLVKYSDFSLESNEDSGIPDGLSSRDSVISRPRFNKQGNNGETGWRGAIGRDNKLPQRSAGNMRRTLMHPRDPARSRRPPGVSIVQQPGIGKSKCVWRPFLAPFSRPSRAFFLQRRRIFYSTALRLARRLILQSHCIKSKACIKQPFAPLPRVPGHPGTRPGRPPLRPVEWDARATIESRKGFPNAISDVVRQLINVPGNISSRSAVKNLPLCPLRASIAARYRIKMQFDYRYSPCKLAPNARGIAMPS